jgi:hypothetical protein
MRLEIQAVSDRQSLVVAFRLGEFGRVLSGRHPTLATVILRTGTTALRFFVSLVGLLRHQDLPCRWEDYPDVRRSIGGRTLGHPAPRDYLPAGLSLRAGNPSERGADVAKRVDTMTTWRSRARRSRAKRVDTMTIAIHQADYAWTSMTPTRHSAAYT